MAKEAYAVKADQWEDIYETGKVRYRDELYRNVFDLSRKIDEEIETIIVLGRDHETEHYRVNRAWAAQRDIRETDHKEPHLIKYKPFKPACWRRQDASKVRASTA